MENRTRMQRLSAFLSGAAIGLFVLLVFTLAVGSHFVTAHECIYDYPMQDLIIYWQDQPVISLLATIGMIAVLMGIAAVLKRYARFHAEKLLYALWAIISIGFLWAIRVQPRADFKVVTDAALLFAQGDFSPLSDTPYFSDYPYQLGICLPMEMLKRLFPWADLALMMQSINVILSISAVYALGKVTLLLTESREDIHAMYGMYLLFLPMMLYCIYVYGTIPMIAAAAWALVYFIKFIHDEKWKDGVLFSIITATAVVFKPNGMIVLITLIIASLLHSLNRRSIRILPYVLISAMLSICLPKWIACLYEWRSGVVLGESISMLSRLVMGFQRSSVAAGWFNGYTALYSPSVMPPEEARVFLLADLHTQFKAFFAEPASLWQFLKEKCMSQWLEPTYSTFWNATLGEPLGRYNGLAYLAFREESVFRQMMERIMGAYQQALYVLCAIGGVAALRRRRDTSQALLPIVILGGFLYHQIFEAKSQYIYVYAFFLMPLAAQGLTAVASWIARRRGMAK